MPYANIIDETVEELDRQAKWKEKKDEVKDRFAQLFDPQIHQVARKLQRLQAGFVPSAIGFSTFVDLRPVFDDGPELDIGGYLPIIQFRITTDSNIPSEKQLVFQLSESALVEFRKALDRMDEKLALLKAQPTITSLIKKV